MAFTLYDATVANYLQTLGAVSGVLDRSLKYFQENNINPDEIPDARLVPDMLPFHFQIASIVQHSKGAVEAVQSGKFSPPKGMPGVNFAGMQAAVKEAHSFMAAMTPDATNALGGKDVNFHLGEHVLPFTAEGFLNVIFVAELLFSRNDRLRSAAHQGRAVGPSGISSARCV